MEETKNCTKGCAGRPTWLYGAGAFLFGLVVALAFGWGIFPDLLFRTQTQPIAFNHALHADTQEISCFTCHSFQADGSFSGLPTAETCAGCHQELPPEPAADASGAEKESYAKRKILTTVYIQGGQELIWEAHQRQPDNVFFSHAAHYKACFTCHLTMKGDLNLGTPEDPRDLCRRCHPSVEELTRNIPVQENILTGYSRTTLKMWQCESCHAFPGHFSNDGTGRTAANNACYTCHK
ncbi:MAG: cytochrome c family protein [Deltaproteobacteria bacterium]|jgi:hypothetical protein|nr:cytochrome c family protein [Deltaproteobacteria bacterium]